MNNKLKINLIALTALMLSFPVFSADGVAVIDMRTAVLSTQAAQDAFKALEEDADYAANLEEARSIQAERQSLAENLQKDAETLSQAEIAEIQRDIQEKGKDLEFLAGKIQTAQEETAQRVFAENGPAMQKIIGELIAAKQISVLLAKNEALLFSDPAIDLTDDVTSMLDVQATETATTEYDCSRRFTLLELSKLINAKLIGDGEAIVDNLSTIQNSNKTSLTFLSNKKYSKYIKTSEAKAFIVHQDFVNEDDKKNFLVSEDPYLSYAMASKLLVLYNDLNNSGIHSTAIVSSDAKIGNNVSIGANVYIGPNCVVETIHAYNQMYSGMQC